MCCVLVCRLKLSLSNCKSKLVSLFISACLWGNNDATIPGNKAFDTCFYNDVVHGYGHYLNRLYSLSRRCCISTCTVSWLLRSFNEMKSHLQNVLKSELQLFCYGYVDFVCIQSLDKVKRNLYLASAGRYNGFSTWPWSFGFKLSVERKSFLNLSMRR